MSIHFLPIGRDVSLLMINLMQIEQVLEAVAKADGGDSPLVEFDKKNLSQIALMAETLGKSIWIEHSILAAMQLSNALRSPCTVSEAKFRTAQLKEILMRDLFRPEFLPASNDMREYLDKKASFGDAVSAAFPTCSEDISEAHNCFAFERYTACVFHVGRAMERAVKIVAKKIGAPTPKRDEWQKWQDAMQVVIEKLDWKIPAEKKKRTAFAEAANFFFNFKEAWRNPTMHPKQTYTRDEALEVLSNTKAFLNSTATKIFKKKAI